MKDVKEVFFCDSCGQELELQKNFGNKKRGIKQKQYRIRRFHCNLCNISKTLFADGFKDENYHPPHYPLSNYQIKEDFRPPSDVKYV